MNEQKKQVLADLLQQTSVAEQKWLLRIILKDMKISLGHEIILRNYHQDALDLFNSTSDLKEVFEQIE